jgi:hypothetical protein
MCVHRYIHPCQREDESEEHAAEEAHILEGAGVEHKALSTCGMVDVLKKLSCEYCVNAV